MIELTKTSAIISAPVCDVFSYVTNMENYGSWFPGVETIKSKNNFPHSTVGKTYLEKLLLPNGEYELTIEVAECENDRLFLTKGNLEGILPQMTIQFHTHEVNKCRLNLQYHSRHKGLTEDSDIIISLRKDLAVRASAGITNLQKILETNT